MMLEGRNQEGTNAPMQLLHPTRTCSSSDQSSSRSHATSSLKTSARSWSASSMTSIRTVSTGRLPDSTRAQSRPGVPTTIWHALRRSRQWQEKKRGYHAPPRCSAVRLSLLSLSPASSFSLPASLSAPALILPALLSLPSPLLPFSRHPFLSLSSSLLPSLPSPPSFACPSSSLPLPPSIPFLPSRRLDFRRERYGGQRWGGSGRKGEGGGDRGAHGATTATASTHLRRRFSSSGVGWPPMKQPHLSIGCSRPSMMAVMTCECRAVGAPG